jgi:hypothetical protein
MFKLSKDLEEAIEKILVVSTCHITEEEDNFLNKNTKFKDPWSFILYISAEETDLYEKNYLGGHKNLIKITSLARQLDCQWVKIDADGKVFDFLDIYEW